ncbi:type IV pilus assembly protein PilN [Paraburkholderia phenazinium]|uniref:Type IV pilus assembly protein PilN n=2 Tax=Paraburkholderia phenazinium TaxID=60549 RepID=A0A1G8NDN0_9BURK|nr:fimbrial assembly protein [Paraburkholderia phenazinium]SDI78369.1 type IV pilus assembly protein PilN [Paraburkholderia phenazinium]
MTWMNSRMGAAGQAVWIGGFNLLPYRQRDARRARRRCLLECLGAALLGCAAVLAVAGWQTFERTRLDTQRVSSEHELARLAPPLAEHARLRHEADQRNHRYTRAVALSAPLMRLLDLLDTLSRLPTDDVALQQLRQRGHETELLATSRDPLGSTLWLKQLSMVRGVKSAEVADLRPLARTGRAVAASGGGTLEFAARLHWDEAAKDAPPSGVSASGPMREPAQPGGVR